MGILGGAYTDYGYGANGKYSQYSSGSSYGTTARVNPTTATRAKIMQTVRDVAQGYSSDLGEIEYYLREGDVDAAIALRTSVFNDIRDTLNTEYNFNVTGRQIQAILDQAYTSINNETTLQSIEENTDGSFMTGIKQAVPIFGLLANSNSKAETVKEALGKYGLGVLAVAGGVAAGIVGLPIVAPALVVAGIASIGQNIIRGALS